MAYVTLGLFILISAFHIYMGFGGKINHRYVIPEFKGKPMPFHAIAALPVAILLGFSALAFAHEASITGPIMYSILLEKYLWLTGIGLLIRGLFGLIVFHLFHQLIDPTPFKTWDLRLYSPLCIYLGSHCLIILL